MTKARLWPTLRGKRCHSLSCVLGCGFTSSIAVTVALVVVAVTAAAVVDFVGLVVVVAVVVEVAVVRVLCG